MSIRRAIAYLPGSPDRQASTPTLASDIDIVASVGHGEDEQAPLAPALERIAAGDASVLLLARLADAAGSLRELSALLDWLAAAGADLVAVDVDLDTASPAGQGTLALVRELARWEREPPPGRTPRGRPGLARRSPVLAAGQRAVECAVGTGLPASWSPSASRRGRPAANTAAAARAST
jgi:hypothetical protein